MNTKFQHLISTDLGDFESELCDLLCFASVQVEMCATVPPFQLRICDTD